MIDDLLRLKLIGQSDYDLYQLFQGSELGQRILQTLMHEAFMDEPNDKEFSEVGFAFYDGRRSILRDIHRTIIKVETILKDEDYARRAAIKPKPKRK